MNAMRMIDSKKINIKTNAFLYFKKWMNHFCHQSIRDNNHNNNNNSRCHLNS